MNGRRDHLQIANQILKEAMEGSRKTRIMYQVNLSFEQLKYYLGALKEAGLLTITNDGNGDIYKTTNNKGIESIRKLDETFETFKPLYERPKK